MTNTFVWMIANAAFGFVAPHLANLLKGDSTGPKAQWVAFIASVVCAIGAVVVGVVIGEVKLDTGNSEPVAIIGALAPTIGTVFTIATLLYNGAGYGRKTE